jgi:enoyl-CoA hydratase/carnithine racemase
MGERLVHYEIENRVAIVSLDNPPMNALDVPTKEHLCDVFGELDAKRGEVRAVILMGAGDKAFAAGADIKAFLDLQPDTAKRRLMKSHRIYAVVENYEWPVIAAIHGYCLGGGLELALCCDIRYAEEGAQFGFPEVGLSIFPGNGGMKRALYHTRLGKMKELVYTGEVIGAEEALRAGLIEKVVPAGMVLEKAKELAAKIMKRGPLGVAAAKKVLNRTRDLSLEQGLELESDVWASLAATEDMKEGARAFIEKRKPEYKGK